MPRATAPESRARRGGDRDRAYPFGAPRGRRITVCAIARDTPHNRPNAAYDHSFGRPAALADARKAAAARYRDSAATPTTRNPNPTTPCETTARSRTGRTCANRARRTSSASS